MTIPQMFFAHSLKDHPQTDWEPLREHLERVAKWAEQFADKFGAKTWGRQLGLWHDLGKYTVRFQNYLLQANGFETHLEEKPSVAAKVDHSTAGAKHAIHEFGQLKRTADGWLLAYAIAGHHTGLPDAVSQLESCLKQRIQKPKITWEGAPTELLAPLPLNWPQLGLDLKQPRDAAFKLALFGRMLFSCLVDADCLATEGFSDPEKSRLRQGPQICLDDLIPPLNQHLARLIDKAEKNEVHTCRQEILVACRDAAGLPPGLFTFTVPTGGGKTLASLAFALEHARLHPSIGFERVICAIPFTSIIEQTAGEYRSVFQTLGDDVVLEHHSNLDPDEARTTPSSLLATENWDAPLGVFTRIRG